MDRNFQIIMSHFCVAAETRSQAKQSEKNYRTLKVPDQIINEGKEEFTKAQATDANLESIRRRVESYFGLVFVGMWLGFVNLAAFVKGQFRKAGLLRFL